MKMTQEMQRNLAGLISALRPGDWDYAAVRGAIHAAVEKFGGSRDAAEISAAALRCAADPTVEHPNAIAQAGPHWDVLEAVFRTDGDGRRYHSRHDRTVIEAARRAEAAAKADPEGHARGIAAARRALAERQTGLFSSVG